MKIVNKSYHGVKLYNMYIFYSKRRRQKVKRGRKSDLRRRRHFLLFRLGSQLSEGSTSFTRENKKIKL